MELHSCQTNNFGVLQPGFNRWLCKSQLYLVHFYMHLVYVQSRHTVVCRAAQEAGAPHREYIDRKNENVIFTPLYLGDHLSDWNQICYTVARQPRESTFQI